MVAVLSIVISSLITDNIVFRQTLGLCPFLGVSKKTDSATGMGLAVTFVIVLATLLCFLLYHYVLVPLAITYLDIIVFILVIACLVQLLDIVLKKFLPSLYNSLGIYLALITTNCAVLGTANNVIGQNLSFFNAMLTALFVGVGFLIALVLMAGVRERMETANVPKRFHGFPIALVAAGIMSMAFMGFNGFSF
jgi:electron transport complex protein RnfA